MPAFPPEFHSVRRRNADSAFLRAENFFFASSVGAILVSSNASKSGEDRDARKGVESQNGSEMVVRQAGSETDVWEIGFPWAGNMATWENDNRSNEAPGLYSLLLTILFIVQPRWQRENKKCKKGIPDIRASSCMAFAPACDYDPPLYPPKSSYSPTKDIMV